MTLATKNKENKEITQKNDTEDGKTEFVYAIDAPYAGTLELKGDDMLLQDFSKKTEELSPEDDSTPETVKEVYPMDEALYDSYISILMEEAGRAGFKPVKASFTDI